MDKLVTSKEYEIHFYEIDYSKKVLISSLMNYFSDIAVQQIEDIDQGLSWLDDKNLGWVLYKWDITMIKYPIVNEKVIVRTWPYSLRKFYAYRQYDVLDLEGNVLCKADSLWFLLDTKKRRPSKVIDEIYTGFRISKDCKDNIDFEKINQPDVADVEKNFYVRYSDIDTNRHVNNVKYVEWCIETVPLDIIENYNIKNVKVVYEKEVKYGETIKVSTQIIKEEQVTCIHKVEDTEGKKLALIKTLWEERKVAAI